ncbi:dual specificity protein phosphatase CDC14A, putative [Eimeria maxima]|uniref:protein-tyrosine-phosphatase n=1 Tax=Eimeria maxima TaxID=5804 RepID=U6M7C7_EIMMA|nr:dual specificity protein phosphatase CDC14A, putative [Eimeria maxima]CDJ57545.1 dual specificity protein phosphatase CDC14A, putative [Eimeria maxima]
MYDSQVFKDAGIDHHDLFFLDGTCPPRDVMEKFVKLAEECDGAVAVHCKAGLGRTGSLIGCYAIKNHKTN